MDDADGGHRAQTGPWITHRGVHPAYVLANPRSSRWVPPGTGTKDEPERKQRWKNSQRYTISQTFHKLKQTKSNQIHNSSQNVKENRGQNPASRRCYSILRLRPPVVSKRCPIRCHTLDAPHTTDGSTKPPTAPLPCPRPARLCSHPKQPDFFLVLNFMVPCFLPFLVTLPCLCPTLPSLDRSFPTPRWW